MDRKTVIGEMRLQRKTYQEIAEHLHISRQRVHQIYKDYVSTPESVRRVILKRDEYRCAICDKNTTPDLDVHHINGIKKDNHLDNLVTLCKDCHARIEAKERKIRGNSTERFFNRVKMPLDKRICIKCNKEFGVARYKPNKFCSVKCAIDSVKLDPEEKKRRHRVLVLRWQKNHQEFSREYTRKYRKEYYKTHPEKNKLYAVKFKEKYNNNQEFREKNLAYQRLVYRRKKILDQMKQKVEQQKQKQ